MREGFRPFEKIVLALTLVMPLVLSPIGFFAHVQIGPLVLWAMLVLVARRTLPYQAQSLSVAQPTPSRLPSAT